MKRTILTPGVLSEGTCKADDIGAALIGALAWLRLSRTDRTKFRALERDYDRLTDLDVDAMSDEQIENLDRVVEDLRMLAEAYVPPFCYIGTHEGDGARLGVWPLSIHEISQDDALQVMDTSDVPNGHTGYVLHVTDHGNATLYSASRGRLRELWSVV